MIIDYFFHCSSFVSRSFHEYPAKCSLQNSTSLSTTVTNLGLNGSILQKALESQLEKLFANTFQYFLLFFFVYSRISVVFWSIHQPQWLKQLDYPYANQNDISHKSNSCISFRISCWCILYQRAFQGNSYSFKNLAEFCCQHSIKSHLMET